LIAVDSLYSAGKPIKLVVNGNTVSMFYDGTIVDAPQTISDAGLMSGTRAGVFARQTFSAGDIVDLFQVVAT
jgi:hypothetical protein